jgi:hypothetical protein
MRSILFLLLLNCSAAAYAHSLTDNPDTLTNRLHVLLSMHHVPMLMLIAAIFAGVVYSRVTRNRHSR